MKQLTIFLALVFILISNLNAQNYKTAVGVRLGFPLSVSGKHFVNESHAIEASVGTRGGRYHRWTNVSAAYQIHNPININNLPEGFQWYWGLGGGAYFWSWDEGYIHNSNSTSFGVQGYIGIDYTFQNIPLNITLDWVPTFLVNGYGNGFGAGYGSIGVRYVLFK